MEQGFPWLGSTLDGVGEPCATTVRVPPKKTSTATISTISNRNVGRRQEELTLRLWALLPLVCDEPKMMDSLVSHSVAMIGEEGKKKKKKKKKVTKRTVG
jgi:TfoX/Sxy family transcriptional regulator of competence genes